MRSPALVQPGKRIRHRPERIDRGGFRDRFPRGHKARQAFSLHEFAHRENVLAVLFAVVNREHRRVPEPGLSDDLADESRPRGGIGAQPGGKEFQGNGPVGLRTGCFVEVPPFPLPQEADDLVRADNGPVVERRLRRGFFRFGCRDWSDGFGRGRRFQRSGGCSRDGAHDRSGRGRGGLPRDGCEKLGEVHGLWQDVMPGGVFRVVAEVVLGDEDGLQPRKPLFKGVGKAEAVHGLHHHIRNEEVERGKSSGGFRSVLAGRRPHLVGAGRYEGLAQGIDRSRLVIHQQDVHFVVSASRLSGGGYCLSRVTGSARISCNSFL